MNRFFPPELDGEDLTIGIPPEFWPPGFALSRCNDILPLEERVEIDVRVTTAHLDERGWEVDIPTET